jgi:hypothetical protein
MVSRKHWRRRGWDWDHPPGKAAVVAADLADNAPAKRPPGHKDKDWCKGAPDHAHTKTIGLFDTTPQAPPCQWRPQWGHTAQAFEVAWSCHHRERCIHCQKVFREPWDLAPAECPAYPGIQAQKAAAETEMAQWVERRANMRWYRRPVITGRQGYRRPRGPS